MHWLKRKRRKEDPSCDVCSRPLDLAIVSQVRGVRDQAEVFFRDLPLLSCGIEGHPRQAAIPDFGVYVIDAVFWKRHIALGRPGTLAKVKCFKCRKNLSKEPVWPGEVAGVLNIAALPEFGIRIRGPMTTCPRCKTEQIWASREVGRMVSSAMVEAFKQAGL